MGCNNKHILQENGKDEKFVEGLLNYVNNEIKNASHQNNIKQVMSIVNIRKVYLST